MGLNLYRIDCLTNMHVGSGDVNYNVVDKEVERDPVLGVPTIHSSGIKGALRVYCENTGKYKNDVSRIFGPERKKVKDNQESSTPGEYKFFSGNLIARPLRISEGSKSFVNVTTFEMIENFLKLLKNFGIKKIDDLDILNIQNTLDCSENKFYTSTTLRESEIEGFNSVALSENESLYALLKKLIGEDFAITDAGTMKMFDLPVLARNQLDDGESNNLWYEEVVPHQSIFYFTILSPGEEFLEFEKVVQIGGNASIGYGYTKITQIKTGV